MNVTYSWIPNKIISEKSYFLKSSIVRSYSDSDLLQISHKNGNVIEDATDCYNLEKPIGNPKHFTKKTKKAKIFYKGKNRLSQFIQSYSDNLKLIGNRRYNEYHPFLFVKDQKQLVSMNTIGLFPVPLKNHQKVKSNEEMYRYKNIQRSIVMMRRMQYERQTKEEMMHRYNYNKRPKNLYLIIRIQRWWKLMNKIIKIQRYYRNRRKLKEIKDLNRCYLIMDNFENFLDVLQARKFFEKLKYHELNKKVCLKPTNITKSIIDIKPEDVEKVIKIQSELRRNQLKKGDRNESDGHLGINSLRSLKAGRSFFTKYTRSMIPKLSAIEKINMIKRQFRSYQRRKIKIERELLMPTMIFKTNVGIPKNPSELICKSLKEYQRRMKTVQKPISIEDTRRFHNAKEYPTYTTKDYYFQNYLNNKNKGEAIIIPLFRYERNVSYITKTRTINNLPSIVRLQNHLTNGLKSILQKDQIAVCYVGKSHKSHMLQKVVDFIEQLRNIMRRSCFRKMTRPLLNKNSISKLYEDIPYLSQNDHILDDNDMEHIIFLQREYRYRYLKKNSELFISKYSKNTKPFSYISINRVLNQINAVIKIQREVKNMQRVRWTQRFQMNSKITQAPIKINSYISKTSMVNSYHYIKSIQNAFRGYIGKNGYDSEINNRYKNSILKSKKNSKQYDQNSNKTIINRQLVQKCYISLKRISDPNRIIKCKNAILNYIDKVLLPIRGTSLINKSDVLNDSYTQYIQGKNNRFLYLMNNNVILKKDLSQNYYISKNRTRSTQSFQRPSHKYMISTEIESSFNLNNSILDNDTIYRKDIKFDYLGQSTSRNILNKDSLRRDWLITKQSKKDKTKAITLIQKSYRRLMNTYQKPINKCEILSKTYIENNVHLIKYIQYNVRKRLLSNKLIENSNMNDYLMANWRIVITKRDIIGRGQYISKLRIIDIQKPIKKLQKTYLKHSEYIKDEEELFSRETRKKPVLKTSSVSKETINNTESVNSIVKIQSTIKSYLIRQEFYKNLNKIKLANKVSFQFYSMPKPIPTRPILNQSVFDKRHKRSIPDINLKFVSLLSLFVVKTTQEYVFPILNKNEMNNTFSYSFYVNTIDRHMKFLKSSQSNESKVKDFMNLIFRLNKSGINTLDDILSLNQNNEKQLSNVNIYDDPIDEDMIDYLNSFCSYDKKFNNPEFIEERLKQVNLNNTSIFGLTRFIDDEYSYLIKGVYCFQCYFSHQNCQCKTIINDEDDDDQFELDNDNPEDCSIRNSINHFNYENRCHGFIIKRKPKINEGIEVPIKQIYEYEDDEGDIGLDPLNLKGSKYDKNKYHSRDNEEKKEVKRALPSTAAKDNSIYGQNQNLSNIKTFLYKNPKDSSNNNKKTVILLRDNSNFSNNAI